MHRLMALLWLRWEYIISNKVLLFVCVVTPFVDFAILQAIPMIHGEMYFLNMGLSLIYSMTAGTFTSMMISEEKDKKKLRTLILSGVTKYNYIISVISFPFIFSVLSALFMPVIFGIAIPSWLTYFVVVVLTTLAFILLNLSIGLFSKTQTHATLFSMIVLIIATFLPMLSSDMSNKIMSYITRFSFIGANTEYFIKLEKFQIFESSVFALICWVVILIFISNFAFKWNAREH